jgi:polyisoprenoid-binding protein YceI
MSIELTQLEGTFALDPSHTRIGFVTRHAMVTKVRGSFNSFEGTAATGVGLENASISVEIDAASVDTRNEQRDEHLRSADFFDVEQYGKIKFVSTEITAPDADVLRVTGNLTIKDVTRPVTIDFEYQGSVIDPWGNTRVGLEGSVVVNRKDFGLTWNAVLEAGGVLVSEKATLEFEVAAVKVS